MPTSLFPAVRTAARCEIRALAFVDRERGGAARVERIAPDLAAEMLLADLPSYGEDVDAAHEAVVRSLAELPAWRLCYRELEDAIGLLRELPVAE